MRFPECEVLGHSRGKEPGPARSEGSAGRAERAPRDKGGAPRDKGGATASAPAGNRGSAAGQGELISPPRLRGTETAPPPGAAGGSAGDSAAEEGCAAGTAGSGASRGSGSGTDSGGGTEHHSAGSSVFPGPAALSRQATGAAGQTDRQVRGAAL